MPELIPFGQEVTGMQVSPGGFEFGVQGWVYGEQRVHSVTFFIDNTAMVSDQYGRPIRGILLDSGKEVLFAPAGPAAQMRTDGRDYKFEPRQWLATHAQVVAALLDDLHIDVIQEMNEAGSLCPTCKGQKVSGGAKCRKCNATGMKQVISCAGWPQLPYEQLKRLKSLPPTTEHQLERIMDPALRRDALKVFNERGKSAELEQAS